MFKVAKRPSGLPVAALETGLNSSHVKLCTCNYFAESKTLFLGCASHLLTYSSFRQYKSHKRFYDFQDAKHFNATQHLHIILLYNDTDMTYSIEQGSVETLRLQAPQCVIDWTLTLRQLT